MLEPSLRKVGSRRVRSRALFGATGIGITPATPTGFYEHGASGRTGLQAAVHAWLPNKSGIPRPRLRLRWPRTPRTELCGFHRQSRTLPCNYIMDAPGHTVGHLNALARVTSNPDSFILMGADTCHHSAEMRPSKYNPLPDAISPHPFHSESAVPCPGALFKPILRDEKTTESSSTA